MLLPLLALWLSLYTATAAPTIQIEAVVTPDLDAVRGEIQFMGSSKHGALTWMDPLAELPQPVDDRTTFRTFRGAKETGRIKWWKTGPNRWRFYSVLPQRFGDIGTDPGRTLAANGGWYPQPLQAGQVQDVQWDITIALPPDAIGALGDQVGTDELSWKGEADRASLIVFNKGQVTHVTRNGIDVRLLTRRKPRKVVLKRLPANLARIRPPGVDLNGVIIELPLRRRLARSGVGQAYFSDRAWRLTPGLFQYHDIATTRVLTEGLLAFSDPFERQLSAAALSVKYQEELKSVDMNRLLRKFSWNPFIHAILYDRSLPFWGDVFNNTHSMDPLQDDLMEVLAPFTRGTVTVKQLLMSYGPQRTWSLGLGLASGLTLETACESANIPIEAVSPWKNPYPKQDYQLKFEKDGVFVKRKTDFEAQPERITVRLNDTVQQLAFSKGASQIRIGDKDALKRIVIDPTNDAAQTTRARDAWPPKILTTVAAWVSSVNVSQGFVVGYAGAWFRGQYDTHNTTSVSVYANDIDSPAVQLGWGHRWGPLQDGLSRPHRFSTTLNAALLDPRFQSDINTDNNRRKLTLGVSSSYAWDTRVSSYFPLRGHRFSLFGSVGFAPVSNQHWSKLGASFSILGSPHPRHVFVGSLSLGWADGALRDRLLRLGGPSSLLSLRSDAAIGTLKGVSKAQYRFAPIRNASIPLGLLWIDEIQGSVGLETGAIWDEIQWRWAVGVTAGLGLKMDLLGAKPFLVGVSLGVPIPLEPQGALTATTPQWVFRVGQAF